jgi:DNA modification methylase
MARDGGSLNGNLRSPKRGKESRSGRSGWYEYYAGFSPDFVQDALGLCAAEPGDATLLDPWNGSGTTTQVGTLCGFDTIGFDLNPVMVIVAKARTLQSNVHQSTAGLLEEIFVRASSTDPEMHDDPLLNWLSIEAATSVRRIEVALQTILIDPNSYVDLAARSSLSDVSALAAFFYVAFFGVMRQLLKPFRTSNPTWIKAAGGIGDRIHVGREELTALLRTQVARMSQDLAAEPPVLPKGMAASQIEIASSLALPLDSGSIQLIITSPPYCTRIDYVVKTGPELALLGLGHSSKVHDLRDRMIGTPTIARDLPLCAKEWGKTCSDLLDTVSDHRSRASKSYYLKTHVQYFDGLYRSLVELDRVLANSGECFLVIQDSYYKEIRIDLAQIVKEMGSAVGWDCDFRRDFPSSRTMVGLNTGARSYSNPRFPVESALHFTKRC